MKAYIIPSMEVIAIRASLMTQTGSGQTTDPSLNFGTGGTGGQGGPIIPD